eukprot:scaffold226096_cov33-Tisochrysis_lutea.AAC.2
MLGEGPRARAPQLLHVTAHTKHQAQVHAKGTNVGACLTRNAEYTEVAIVVVFDQGVLIHSAHTELPLDGRDERRALEERASELLQSSVEGACAFNGSM